MEIIKERTDRGRVKRFYVRWTAHKKRRGKYFMTYEEAQEHSRLMFDLYPPNKRGPVKGSKCPRKKKEVIVCAPPRIATPKKCCLCGKVAEYPFIERRPTGPKGQLEPYAFCDPTGPNCITITNRTIEIDKIASLAGASSKMDPQRVRWRYIRRTEGENASQAI
jgi:hypothetical protein